MGHTKKVVKMNCMVCREDFVGDEPEYCCDGYMCGCMGLPTEPIVCSEECYDKGMKNGFQYEPKRTFIKNLKRC